VKNHAKDSLKFEEGFEKICGSLVSSNETMKGQKILTLNDT